MTPHKSLATRIRLVLVLCLLAAGAFLSLAAAEWMKGIVLERYQRLERLAK